MSEEILINVTPRETRVSMVENGVLQEVHIERTGKRGIVGNIYYGKVNRVLPGMQAAFVDIGLDKAAFLHVSDIGLQGSKYAEHFGTDDLSDENPVNITEVICEGQMVLVQVTKDPLGTKGARLTTQLSIPSRYLVMMPNVPHVGISTRIEDEDERIRLRELVDKVKSDEQHGIIVRTAAEGVEENALTADLEFLIKLWDRIKERPKAAGNIIYEDLSLAMRTIRDLTRDEIEKIRIDSRTAFVRLKAFADEFVPRVSGRLEYYAGERPIFDLYGIEDELQKALERKVQLKSGGYLVIDQTEAMTTVDVNTGGFVGHRNLEETIYKTNLEAASAVARQLRLRNLGGIVIIDFIDMTDESHKRQVFRVLEKALEKDHAKTHICEVSPLGLVEMTRKRTRESLEHILCESCSTCSGRGTIKTAETACYEIFREIIRAARAYGAKQLMVLASQPVVDRMLDEESASLAELETFIGCPINLQVEAYYSQEQFDVVLV